MKKSQRILLLCAFLTAWFIPWVFVLRLGVIIYRPYEPDGVSRYFRMTGPVPEFFTDVQWADGKDLPKSCRRALVVAEDSNFYDHFGLDPESIEDAIKRNDKRGKVVWGGSTITQQLVKNLFLSRRKTYLRKAREAIGAVLLDMSINKEDQITWYFNAVEFGPNIYGIKEAARYYFNRTPNKLSTDQCVMLVAVLPHPNRSHFQLKSKHFSKTLKKRMKMIRQYL